MAVLESRQGKASKRCWRVRGNVEELMKIGLGSKKHFPSLRSPVACVWSFTMLVNSTYTIEQCTPPLPLTLSNNKREGFLRTCWWTGKTWALTLSKSSQRAKGSSVVYHQGTREGWKEFSPCYVRLLTNSKMVGKLEDSRSACNFLSQQ